MFGLGQLDSIIGEGRRQIESNTSQEASLEVGNKMGLTYQVGDPVGHYEALLSDFDNLYEGAMDVKNLTPDDILASRTQASAFSEQAKLASQYRKTEIKALGAKVENYKSILEAQRETQGFAQDVQRANIDYLKNTVGQSYQMASSEANFAGWLSAYQAHGNDSQSYVSWE